MLDERLIMLARWPKWNVNDVLAPLRAGYDAVEHPLWALVVAQVGFE
jgi:hypothetical protein